MDESETMMFMTKPQYELAFKADKDPTRLIVNLEEIEVLVRVLARNMNAVYGSIEVSAYDPFFGQVVEEVVT